MPSQHPEPTVPTTHPVTGRTTPGEAVVRRPPSAASVVPDVTSDEREIGWGEVPEPDDDNRLLREVPPHHGS